MSDSGPTTAGSIVARLKMDRDQWVADMAKTKADANEIGRLSPTVRVDANVSAALAKIEMVRAAYASLGGGRGGGLSLTTGGGAGDVAKIDAVAAAEKRLAAAASAADSAFARAELAQMRLNETREKGTVSASRLASAELSATEAVKRLDAANERATASEAALTVAQEKAAQAALKKAAAEQENESKTVKANEANRTSVTRLGAITTAVAVLIPLIAPLAAGAAGLGGAFLGMGVAGVFALVGIKREMAQGTAIGNAYGAGIASLKANMSTLSATAAINMLSSFRRVVGETSAAMPFLNIQVGQFSSLLGQSGGNFFSGALTGLRVMNPLLLTAGAYVVRLSEGFESWTSNGGLEKFTGYALGAFPQVVDLLGALATAVVHILTALAPLGAVGMAVLTGISDTISAIPVEVLGALISAVLWGTLAFKAWGFIAPMLSTIAAKMTAVGAATYIATGPIGWIVAGVAALAAVFTVSMVASQSASDAMREYTAAVEADTGAVGENVAAKAALKLEEAGVLEAAQKLGISSQLVLKSTLGETAAQKEYAQALSAVQDRVRESADGKSALAALSNEELAALAVLVPGVDAESAAIAGSVEAYNRRQEALGESTTATEAETAAVEAMAAAAGVSVDAYLAAESAQGDTKSQLERTTAAMFLQNDAAGLLKQSLDLLNGKTLSAESAQNRFESQLVNMKSYIDEATGAIDTNAAALSGMSDAAVSNRSELIGQVEAAQISAQAFRDQGNSSEETRLKMIAMKDEIVANAVANGRNRDEVQAYIDKLFQIPASVPPTKIEVDDANARARIESFIAMVNSRVATIQVRATMPDLNGTESGSGRPGIAMGGTIAGLAGGGSGGTVNGPGTAGSDTAGLYRLAAGEEVISNIFGQADKNRGLLKAINAGFVPDPTPAGTVGPARETWSTAPKADRRGGDVSVTFINPVAEDPLRSAQAAADLIGAAADV